VQLMLDREAENLAVGNRNATRQHIRIGAKRDGTLTVLTADIQQQVGAYMVGGEASNVSGPYQAISLPERAHRSERGIHQCRTSRALSRPGVRRGGVRA
jgi:CO/xanthine dehydrogenase Mo-binding subunit